MRDSHFVNRSPATWRDRISMANRRPYRRKLTVLSAWTLKAIGLVIAGATIVIVARTVTKGVTTKFDSPAGGKFVGVRHQATAMPSDTDRFGQGQERSDPTVVRNGLTVVSPPLLVPVVDIDSFQRANGSADDAFSTDAPTTGKQVRSNNRSHRQSRFAAKRWKAYGVAIR